MVTGEVGNMSERKSILRNIIELIPGLFLLLVIGLAGKYLERGSRYC